MTTTQPESIQPKIVYLPSKHFSDRRNNPVVAIVVHATAGKDSRAWLVNNPRGVSIHVLIQKDGTIYEMVDPKNAAHHVGFSTLTVNGVSYGIGFNTNANLVTLGIELENLNDGRDPYTEPQLLSMGYIIRLWRQKFGDLPIFRHADIDTHGKTDPVNLSVDMIERYVTSAGTFFTDGSFSGSTNPEPVVYSLVGQNTCTENQVKLYVAKNRTVTPDIERVIAGYEQMCAEAGLNFLYVVAQSLHETNIFSSFWFQEPRRNTCGFDVTGQQVLSVPANEVVSIVYNVAHQRWSYRDGFWHRGVSFPTWEHAIGAHIGRLLAYIYTDNDLNDTQKRFVKYALSIKPLPPQYRGRGPDIRILNRSWAVGEHYTQGILRHANNIIQVMK